MKNASCAESFIKMLTGVAQKNSQQVFDEKCSEPNRFIGFKRHFYVTFDERKSEKSFCFHSCIENCVFQCFEARNRRFSYLSISKLFSNYIKNSSRSPESFLCIQGEYLILCKCFETYKKLQLSYEKRKRIKSEVYLFCLISWSLRHRRFS